jgi:chromosome segregation ATPase
LSRQIVALEEKIRDLDVVIGGINRENGVLGEELRERDMVVIELEEVREGLVKEGLGRESELGQLERRVSELMGEVEGLRGKVKGKDGELDRGRKDLRDVKMHSDKLGDSLENRGLDNQGLREKIEGLMDELAKSAENFEILRQNHENLSSEHRGLVEAHRGLGNDYNKKHQLAEDLQYELTVRNAENDRLSKANTALRGQLTDLQTLNRQKE